MDWIIPIGGKGTRTHVLGEFKPFIEIAGHKMLDWFFVSIKANISEKDYFTFLTHEHYARKYNVEKEIYKLFQNLEISNKFKVLSFDQEYPGVSGAIHAAGSMLATANPTTVICPDQYIDFDLPESIPLRTGFLPTQAEFGKMRGYVQIKNEKVVLFAEKDNISNFGNCGVYIFSQGKDILQAVKKQLSEKLSIKGEYYIGSALNYLIRDGYNFYPIPVRVKYDLGNIPDILHFEKTPLAKGLSQLL